MGDTTPLESVLLANNGPFEGHLHCSIIRALQSASPMSPDQTNQEYRIERARKIWLDGKPIANTLAEKYLASRGIVFKGEYPNALRFVPTLLHEPTMRYLPALIALVTAIDGSFAGIYRIYLAEDGLGKAKVAKGGVKRMLGECWGSYVQLTQRVSNDLAIAKSVESALSIRQACPDINVWAAMNIENYCAPVSKGVQNIILCHDRNHKDTKCADSVLRSAIIRHLERGHKVCVSFALHGSDFNDMLNRE